MAALDGIEGRQGGTRLERRFIQNGLGELGGTGVSGGEADGVGGPEGGGGGMVRGSEGRIGGTVGGSEERNGGMMGGTET